MPRAESRSVNAWAAMAHVSELGRCRSASAADHIPPGAGSRRGLAGRFVALAGSGCEALRRLISAPFPWRGGRGMLPRGGTVSAASRGLAWLLWGGGPQVPSPAVGSLADGRSGATPAAWAWRGRGARDEPPRLAEGRVARLHDAPRRLVAVGQRDRCQRAAAVPVAGNSGSTRLGTPRLGIVRTPSLLPD